MHICKDMSKIINNYITMDTTNWIETIFVINYGNQPKIHNKYQILVVIRIIILLCW